jgi:spermidine/putrescine transport system substrate-binding protein
VGGVLSFTGSGKKGAAGGSGTGDTIPGGGTLGTGSTEVRILNWQAYIDPTDGGTVGTVDRFLKDTGVKATYSEDFNDNNEVYAREIEPYLGHGQKANFDIICPTFWMAARLRKLDWIEPLPLDLIPNRVNLEDRFVTDAWNFGGTYSLPWQSGMTGIAFNPKLTGRDLTSFDDLLDPKFKGKVALLTEMRDSLGLAMLSMGKDPSVLDEDAMNAALDKIEKATKDGQFRAFTGNEYLRSLQSGDFVACVAWSGDMQQLGYTRPDIKFVLPEAGAMAWYDTMIIPKGAPNGVAAAKWMNYVYDPVNAAKITAYVQYASPVKGVKEELIKMGGDAAKLAESQLIFPDAESQKRLHIFAAMPDDVDARISARFLKITNG